MREPSHSLSRSPGCDGSGVVTMSKGTTLGWTEQHTGVALCAVLLCAGGLLAGLEAGTFRLVVVGLTVLCAVASLFFDGFVGLVIGLACAAAAVVLKRYIGVWNPEEFFLATTIAVCLVVLGWACGLVGTRIRRSSRASTTSGGAVGPAYGSLGLLTEESARQRLEDEIGRAREHGRSLGVLMIALRFTDDTLMPDAHRSAERAIARLVESLLRVTDVPFALSGNEFGAILPETDSAAGWSLVGPLMDAAGRATFTNRTSEGRSNIADCAELHAGLVFLTEQYTDVDALMTAARTAHGAANIDSDAPSNGRTGQVAT